VQGVSRNHHHRRVPLSTLASELRIWASMTVSLLCVFLLPRERLSAAGSKPSPFSPGRPGQPYQKAVYRILSTIIGVVASFVSLRWVVSNKPQSVVIGFRRPGSGSASTVSLDF